MTDQNRREPDPDSTTPWVPDEAQQARDDFDSTTPWNPDAAADPAVHPPPDIDAETMPWEERSAASPVPPTPVAPVSPTPGPVQVSSSRPAVSIRPVEPAHSSSVEGGSLRDRRPPGASGDWAADAVPKPTFAPEGAGRSAKRTVMLVVLLLVVVAAAVLVGAVVFGSVGGGLGG